MGQKVHPIGIRLGITKEWTSKWFADSQTYPLYIEQDHIVREFLGKKLKEHKTQVYLVNTGWAGGPYGVGERMDIMLTRALVDAALSGKLENVEYEEDKLFHLSIPKECPGVSANVLFPKEGWTDKAAFDARAKKLAEEFSAAFDKNYGGKGLDPKIVAECPGK